MTYNAVQVFGPVVDDQTRCVHYATERDIVAIRFFCCDRYYPCHQCHTQTADHSAKVWPREQFDRDAIMCGVCRRELTIEVYVRTDRCPGCDSEFNPGCCLHRHLYFAD